MAVMGLLMPVAGMIKVNKQMTKPSSKQTQPNYSRNLST